MRRTVAVCGWLCVFAVTACLALVPAAGGGLVAPAHKSAVDARSAAQAGLHGSARRCAPIPPSAKWSKKKRMCFLVSASASWEQTDLYGAPCTAEVKTSMRWSVGPSPLWVGTTFPLSAPGVIEFVEQDGSIGLSDDFGPGGYVRGRVSRTVSGTACGQLMTTDCGSKPLKARLGNSYVYVRKRSDLQHRALVTGIGGVLDNRPFRACGSDVDLSPRYEPELRPDEWAKSFYHGGLSTTIELATGSPSKRSLEAKMRNRVLATRLGGAIVFRGRVNLDPVDFDGVFGPRPPFVRSGRWSGSLTFRRVS